MSFPVVRNVKLFQTTEICCGTEGVKSFVIYVSEDLGSHGGKQSHHPGLAHTL